ncbi:MAG: bifunctional riboflavin kinase/FAD synthetase [Acidobacteria bacterium]|nr:bifunctional riboflavin kinase/FAD synthetase [Acidobacteriota bacterium]
METVYFGERSFRLSGAVVTIGNFDGIHVGHQRILKRGRQVATGMGVPLVVISFKPHPGKILNPQHGPEIIKTDRQKRELLRQQGVDYYFVIRFTPEFSRMEPEKFLNILLVETLGARYVLVGAGFAFGRKRSGDVKLISRFGKNHGIEVEPVPHVMLDGEVVSSSSIRSFLKNGKVRKANRFLGRYYYMEGIVIHGEQLGRKLGFPTANIISENELTPLLGVYASVTGVEGKQYESITNIGLKPTFGGKKVIVETHLFDFDMDIYGEEIFVAFVEFIRPEMKFDSVQNLIQAIERDCMLAKEILGKERDSGSLCEMSVAPIKSNPHGAKN